MIKMEILVLSIGKKSFSDENLIKNFNAIIRNFRKRKIK